MALPNLEPLVHSVSSVIEACSNLLLDVSLPIANGQTVSSQILVSDPPALSPQSVKAYVDRVALLQRDLASASKLLIEFEARLPPLTPTASISSLPTELILSIIEFVLAANGAMGPPVFLTLRLSHVCSFWRNAMVSQAKFWTAIPFDVRNSAEILVEYARRAAALPLKLRVLGRVGPGHAKIPMPLDITDRIRTLELTDPDHVKLLEFPTTTIRLDVLRLGGGGAEYQYLFDEHAPHSIYRSACTIVCDHSSMTKSGRTPIKFAALRTLEIDGRSGDEITRSLTMLNAPQLDTLRISYAGWGVTFGGARSFRTDLLRHLHVIGDGDSAAVVGSMLALNPPPMLESFTWDMRSHIKDHDFEDWNQGIANLFTFASRASTFSISGPDSGLAVHIPKLEHHTRLSAVGKLKITLVPSTLNVDAGSSSVARPPGPSPAQQGLREFLERRRGHVSNDVLQHLCVSRALIDGDEQWYTEGVAFLEVMDD